MHGWFFEQRTGNCIFEFLVQMLNIDIFFACFTSHTVHAFYKHNNRGKYYKTRQDCILCLMESKQCCKNCSRKRCKKVLDKKYMFELVYMRQQGTKGEERRGRGWRNEGTKLGDKSQRSSVNTVVNEKAGAGEWRVRLVPTSWFLFKSSPTTLKGQ
jgi:hypothetical protein